MIKKSRADNTFHSDLQRTKGIISISDHLQTNATSILSDTADDLLRLAVVQTVGSIDSYFSNVLFELLIDESLLTSSQLTPDRSLLSFSITDVSNMLSEKDDPLHLYLHRRRIISEKIDRIPFQHPNTPARLAKILGYSHFWDYVERGRPSTLSDSRELKSQYKDIIDRRNQIAHSIDRFSSADISRDTISSDTVREYFTTVSHIQDCFESAVVGPHIQKTRPKDPRS